MQWKGLSKSEDLKISLRRQAGWVPLLGKYLNVETGLVSETVPIDIWAYQEELVRRFSTFTAGVEDVYEYFLCLRDGAVGTFKSNNQSIIIADLIRELCRPSFYTECVDSVFFGQKCEKMKELLKDNNGQCEPQTFKEFLKFLAEKRKGYSQITPNENNLKLATVVETAITIRKSNENDKKSKKGKQKFYEDCSAFVSFDENMLKNYNASSFLALQGKNKIQISADKSKVQIMNEILQKLNVFEKYKLELKCQFPTNSLTQKQQLFQFYLQGNDFCILGEIQSSKQKAKESCCEVVLNEMIKFLAHKIDQNNSSMESIETPNKEQQIEDNENTMNQNDDNPSNILLFSPEDVKVAPLKFLPKLPKEKSLDSTQKLLTNATNTAFGEKENIKQNQNDTNYYFDKRNQTAYAKNSPNISQNVQGQNSLNKKIIQGNAFQMQDNYNNGTGLCQNEFMKIKIRLEQIAQELGVINTLELNPFTIFKKAFSELKAATYAQKMKQFGDQLLEIITIAVKLYDYLELKQSPCVLVQEDGHTFFLKTIIMKKDIKGRPLMGRTRAATQDQAFICSAIEVIYKFAFKHQGHNGQIKNLEQVIEGLIIEAEYKSEEIEKEKKEIEAQKEDFCQRKINNVDNNAFTSKHALEYIEKKKNNLSDVNAFKIIL